MDSDAHHIFTSTTASSNGTEEGANRQGQEESAVNHITLLIQRMYHDRVSVEVEADCLVEDLRNIIYRQTQVPATSQRLIFRGRVLRNGQRLSHYGIVAGHVIHLVERPDGTNATGWSEPPSGTPIIASASSTTGPGGPRRGVNGGANVLFHALQIDGNETPTQLAQTITRSLIGALGQHFSHIGQTGQMGPIGITTETRTETHFTGDGNFTTTSTAGPHEMNIENVYSMEHEVPTNPNNPTNPTNPPNLTNPANSTNPANPVNPIFTNLSNLFMGLAGQSPAARNTTASNPTPTTVQNTSATTADHTTPSISFMSNGSNAICRLDSQLVMQILIKEIERITRLTDGSPLFPTISTSSNAPITDPRVHQLTSLLEHFERCFWMLASGCRQVREALESRDRREEVTTPVSSIWPQFTNLNGLIREVDPLMSLLNELLEGIRAHPNDSVDIPTMMEVPRVWAETLNPSGSSSTTNTATNGTEPITPRHTASPSSTASPHTFPDVTIEMNFENIIEPPE